MLEIPVRVTLKMEADLGVGIMLFPGENAVVGRSGSSLSVPNDRHMSMEHFQLFSDKTGCLVRDLESSNGTFVNGNRVIEAALLDGDQIRAGRTTFVVRLETDLRQEGPPLDLLEFLQGQTEPLVRDPRCGA